MVGLYNLDRIENSEMIITSKVRDKATSRNASKRNGARKFRNFVSNITKKVSSSVATKNNTAIPNKKINGSYNDDDSCSNIYLTSSSEKEEEEEEERDGAHSIPEQRRRDDTSSSSSSSSTSAPFIGRKTDNATHSMITKMIEDSNSKNDTNDVNNLRNKEGTATCDSTLFSSDDNEDFYSDNQEESSVNDWEGRTSAELQIEKLWMMSQRFETKELTELSSSLSSSPSFCSKPKEEDSLEEIGEQQEGRQSHGYNDDDEEGQYHDYGDEVELYHNYGPSQPLQKGIYDVDKIVIDDDDSCDEDSMCSFDVLPLYMTDDDALDEISITQGLVGYADGFESHTMPILRIEELNGEEKPEI